MTHPLRLAALAAFLTLSACASPEEGDDCSPNGSGTCTSGTQALFCESGTFRAIPCSGPTGCIEDDDRVACDFSRATAGEACPRANEAQAQCATGQPDNALICTDGTWVTRDCKGCAIQGGNVVCQL